MAWARSAALLGCCIALAGCMPSGEGAPSDGYAVPAPPPDTGAYDAPLDAGSPVATAGEIQDYLYDGSVEVSWYGTDEALYQIDCGFIDGYGAYKADSFESDPDGYYYYDSWLPGEGTWLVQGSQLCVSITYYDDVTGQTYPAGDCYTVEWSTEESLLLIDRNNQVAAEVFAWDGNARYLDGCAM